MADLAGPTNDEFAEVLFEVVGWYTLGIFIGVPSRDLDEIDKTYSKDEPMRRLIEMYKCIKKRGIPLSWKHVADSLIRMNYRALADQIYSNYILPSWDCLPSACEPQQLQELITVVDHSPLATETITVIYHDFVSISDRFAMLVADVFTSLESTADIKRMQHLMKYRYGLKPLPEEKVTFEAVFERLSNHFSVLNFHILIFLVKYFLPEKGDLIKKIEDYEAKVNQFKSTAKMRQLADLIKRNPTATGNHAILKLKVRSFWEEFTMEQFEKVVTDILGTIYNLVSHISVGKGCMCVTWTIPDVVGTKSIELQPLEFIRVIGVISLHIGDTVVYDIPGEGCEVLEAAMIQAVELKNTRAVERFLAVGCDPEVATYRGNNVTNIVNIKDSNSTTGTIGHFCVFGQDKNIEDICEASKKPEKKAAELEEKMYYREMYFKSVQENESLKHFLIKEQELSKMKEKMHQNLLEENNKLKYKLTITTDALERTKKAQVKETEEKNILKKLLKEKEYELAITTDALEKTKEVQVKEIEDKNILKKLLKEKVPKGNYHIICGTKEEDGAVHIDVCVAYSDHCSQVFKRYRENFNFFETIAPFSSGDVEVEVKLPEDSNWRLEYREFERQNIREDEINFYQLLNCTPATVTDTEIETLLYYEQQGFYPPCVKLSFSPLQSLTYNCEAQIILSSQGRSISIPIKLKGNASTRLPSTVSIVSSDYSLGTTLQDSQDDSLLAFLEPRLTDWMGFGHYLIGLDVEALHEIEEEINKDPVKTIMHHWREKSPNGSYHDVANALKSLRCYFLSDMLTVNYCSSASNASVCSICQPSECDLLTRAQNDFEILNTEPDLRDLNDLVGAKIPHKWELFGAQLNINQSILEALEKDYTRDCQLCFQNVFIQWQRTQCSSYTWQTIVKALYSPSVGEYALAEEIYRRFKNVKGNV